MPIQKGYWTYEIAAAELEALEASHGVCARIDITECDVGGGAGNWVVSGVLDFQDSAIYREKHV